MERIKEHLTSSEESATAPTIDNLFDSFKDNSGKFSIKDFKYFLYYSRFYEKNAMAYKSISDLEISPESSLSKEELHNFVLGKDFGSQPPTVEEICIVN